MKYKIYTVNADNKIEFTKEELQKLMDDVYQEGYKDGKDNFTITTPSLPRSYPDTTGTQVKPWWYEPTVTMQSSNDDINRPITTDMSTFNRT